MPSKRTRQCIAKEPMYIIITKHDNDAIPRSITEITTVKRCLQFRVRPQRWLWLYLFCASPLDLYVRIYYGRREF
jgi:hypothetical protein